MSLLAVSARGTIPHEAVTARRCRRYAIGALHPAAESTERTHAAARKSRAAGDTVTVQDPHPP